MGWADSGFPKNRRDIKRAEKRQALETWEKKLKGILFNEVSNNVVNIK